MILTKMNKHAMVAGFLLASFSTMRALIAPSVAPAAETTPVIKISASKFHFTPDQITLHRGEPAVLQLTSTDRTHGFLLRILQIDTDVEPGKTRQITVTPTQTGVFRAICDHYCGFGHGGMKMTVVVDDKPAG